MRLALDLARQSTADVRPNPKVGAVIVKDGVILGQGYHQYFGGPHAEIEALKNAKSAVQNATMYVTLEPCCHYGKTPPCTDAIIKAGIKRVVIGMADPNPLVHLKGVEILRQNGIEVETGIEEEACKQLNREFMTYITTGFPFVTMKIAQTLDGRIATRNRHSKWITSPEARKVGHQLRSDSDAVIVGIGTVLADNPRLTVRHLNGRMPFRIVMDSRLRLPMESHLLTDEFTDKTIIATISADSDKRGEIISRGAQIWDIPADNTGRISVAELLKKAVTEKFSAVMVEGGSEVYTSFLKEKLVHRLVLILAPKLLGAGINSIGDLNVQRIDQALELHHPSMEKVGEDFIFTADINY